METNDDNLLGNVFDTILTYEDKRNENRKNFYDTTERYAKEYIKKVRQELDNHAKQHYGYIFGESVKILLGQDSDEDLNAKISKNIDGITMLEIHNANPNETGIVSESLWSRINSLSNLGSIKFLGVSITGDQLKPLHNLKFLQELSISNAPKLDNFFECFHNFSKLDSICIDNSKFVSLSWQNLQHNTKLTGLCCNNCSLTDTDFVNFPPLPSLNCLTLRNNNLTCINFGFINDLSNLSEVDVWDNPRFGIDGLEVITASGENTIKDILVQGCPLIDDSCMQCFLPMKKIQVISLSRTNITENGLEQLKTIKTLRHLFLPEQISVEFAKKLQEKYMPKCNFTWSDNHERDLHALEWSEDYD
jgi:hypothetical protein